MRFFFSFRGKDHKWSDPEEAPSAKDAREQGYQKSGRRRGNTIICDEDSLDELKKFIETENKKP